MILGLTSMIGLLKIHVSILSNDTISNSNIGLHGAKRIFLLDEIYADVALPIVGAGFIENIEVCLLA
jgi:hypothetical protein